MEGSDARGLVTLAQFLRGMSYGDPLVLNGGWDELTQAQRDRWLLFASRARDAVVRMQTEQAAHGSP